MITTEGRWPLSNVDSARSTGGSKQVRFTSPKRQTEIRLASSVTATSVRAINISLLTERRRTAATPGGQLRHSLLSR